MILRSMLVLLAPLLLAACADRPLAACTGPVRQLNVGRWFPGPNDLSLPPVPGRSGE